jgi:hypothetical protein
MKLPTTLLNRALKATLLHGYGEFFPLPPELELVKRNWADVVVELASIDLDTYEGYDPIFVFAPKSRVNVRRVGLLHPYDFIFYTALVLALKSSISKSRLPEDRVFSYRTEETSPSELYRNVSHWKQFRAFVERRADQEPNRIVGVTDIADFFPRIYHHRLVNALQASSGEKEKSFIRALEKMLSRFSTGTSYGIPIGPPASRLLAEAVLIDVDSTLLSFGFDFIRFVDDYIFFTGKVQDAEYCIRVLGETLFLNHGLTLQTSKTKISTASEYVQKHLVIHSDKEKNRRQLLQLIQQDDYEITSYDDLDEENKAAIDAFNLGEMLHEALGENENVNYREVQFILGRLSALQKPELIPTVLENLDRLYPVAESVAAFFTRFANLPREKCQEISDAVLAPMFNQDARPSEYYSIWILSIFQHHANWAKAADLLKIFRETSTDAVRRFAALALANCGTRAQALSVKDYFTSASSLCRTAMLLTTVKLGRDERHYFGRSLRLSDSLEKLCIKANARSVRA